MPHNYGKESYREISKQLETATRWLHLNGIKVHPTRVQKYNKDMMLIAEMHEKKDRVNLRKKWVDFVHSSYEGQEIIDIYDGLKDVPIGNELRERLIKYVSGPIIISHEVGHNASHVSRDIGFELYTGAKLIRA